jgi:hypothetical protein
MKIVARNLLVFLYLVPACAMAAAPSAAPKFFAPGVISGPDGDACPAFLPDGRHVLFWRDSDASSSIMASRKDGDQWSTPVTATFSGHWRDLDPTMAPDGSFLLFVSNRPATPDGKRLDGTAKNGKVYPGFGMNIWRVDRIGDGWGKPVRLPSRINTSTATFAPSIAGDGSIYYMARDPGDGDFHLFHASFVHGQYASPERVALGDAKTVIRDPVIAPDQSFIVVSTTRSDHKSPLRLAIAFRKHGQWSALTDLGDTVNGNDYAMGGQLGPDHRTLYFYSARLDASAASGSAWNNHKDNIWSVSLAPWLHAPQ